MGRVDNWSAHNPLTSRSKIGHRIATACVSKTIFRSKKHCLKGLSHKNSGGYWYISIKSSFQRPPSQILIRPPHIIKLHSMGSHIIKEYGERVNCIPTIHLNLNQKLLAFLYLYFCRIWNNVETKKLLHLELSKQSGIVEPFILMIIKFPFIKLKNLIGSKSCWLRYYSNTHLFLVRQSLL